MKIKANVPQVSTKFLLLAFCLALPKFANADTYANIDGQDFGPVTGNLGLVTFGTGTANAAYNDLGAYFAGNGFADAGFKDVVSAPTPVTIGGLTYGVAALQFTVTLTGTITPAAPPNPTLATGYGSLNIADLAGCTLHRVRIGLRSRTVIFAPDLHRSDRHNPNPTPVHHETENGLPLSLPEVSLAMSKQDKRIPAAILGRRWAGQARCPCGRFLPGGSVAVFCCRVGKEQI